MMPDGIGQREAIRIQASSRTRSAGGQDGLTAEAEAQSSTQHATTPAQIGDGQCPMAVGRLIEEGKS
jgi:hypothetical protein